MPQRWRGAEGKALVGAAAGQRSPASAANKDVAIKAVLDLFDEGAVRGPFGIPQAGRRMNRRGEFKAFQFRPEWIVKWMGEIHAFEKHRADEGATKTGILRDPPQLLDRVIHVLQGNH